MRRSIRTTRSTESINKRRAWWRSTSGRSAVSSRDGVGQRPWLQAGLKFSRLAGWTIRSRRSHKSLIGNCVAIEAKKNQIFEPPRKEKEKKQKSAKKKKIVKQQAASTRQSSLEDAANMASSKRQKREAPQDRTVQSITKNFLV